MSDAINPAPPGVPSCPPISTAASAARKLESDRLSGQSSNVTESIEPSRAALPPLDAQGMLTGNVQVMPMEDAHSMPEHAVNRGRAQGEHAMNMGTEHTAGIQNGQTVSRHGGHGVGSQSEQTLGTPEEDQEPELLYQANMAAWTANELKVLRFFQAHRHCRTNYRYIAKEHGIPFGTVRRIVQRLVSAGYIRYQPFRDGSQQGIEVKYSGPDPVEHAADFVTGHAGQEGTGCTGLAQTKWAESEHPAHIEERERERIKDPSIWNLSVEQIEELWPHVKKAGLFASHLREVRDALELQGIEDKPGKLVALTLRYLDWQLAKGPIIDQHGKAVGDPIAYWRAAMKRNGYYQKPAGYEDPHDVYLREVAEAEKAEANTLREANQVREEREKSERLAELNGILQALVDQGERHPLWQPVYQLWSERTRQEVASKPDIIVSSPGVAATTRIALRKIYGWPE